MKNKFDPELVIAEPTGKCNKRPSGLSEFKNCKTY